MARGVNPTKLDGSEKFTPRVSQTIDGWRKADPPAKKMLPVDIDVPNYLEELGRQQSATPLMAAVGCLTLVAFYFLLRVGEYTKCSGDTQTEQFRVKDVRFFAMSTVTGREHQLHPGASNEKLMAATSVTLRLENQKNGWKNVCVHQEENGHEHACPVRALAARVIAIRQHTTNRDTPLSAYWEDGERKDVDNGDIRVALKDAAEELHYPFMRGIDINQVDTHSLRCGGANALHLAGCSDRVIMKMGRWKSKTFLEYIREELGNFSSGISRKMARSLKYVNVTGDRWSDVTAAVVVTDCESGEE